MGDDKDGVTMHPGSAPYGDDKPICSPEESCCTRNRSDFICVRLYTYPRCKPDTEEMIHNLEPLTSCRIIGTRYVHYRGKLTLGMVSEECENGHDGGRSNVECELVTKDTELLNKFREGLDKIRSIFMQRFGQCCVLLLPVDA
jgi:hypothetical protein